MMYAARTSMYDAGKIALGCWLLISGCTDAAPRPAPQPAPAPVAAASKPELNRELRAERGSLRLGVGPSKHRLVTAEAEPVAEPPPAAEPPGFLGKPERAALEQLRTGTLASVKKGSGGRTLAFKLTFDSGAEGYYKPEQRIPSANWYAEVVAYHLDRALGLGRVPPVVARKFAWTQLEAAAEDDPRRKQVVVGRDGQVRGALIQWLNDGPVPAVTPPGWENWIRGDRKPPVRYLEVPEPSRSELPAELSDMIVFDFLTLNYDRFGAGNVNLLTLGPGGPLISLDNGAAFSPGPARRSVLDARLLPLAKFRRRTIDALRALDVKALGATLAADPVGPLLDSNMLRGLETRRAAVLEHVAKQEGRYGAAVYAW
jgi:hypothetical protein